MQQRMIQGWFHNYKSRALSEPATKTACMQIVCVMEHCCSPAVGEIGGDVKPIGLVKPYCGKLVLCGAT